MGKKKKLFIFTLIMFPVFLVTLSFIVSNYSSANISQKEIRWIISHEPVDYFLRAATRFKEIVEKESRGQLVVNIILYGEDISLIGETYETLAAKSKWDKKAEEMLMSNEVQMMQISNSKLAKSHPELYVLDLPRIFKDYDHIDAVIEGPVGRKLMASLDDMLTMKPLAFTFSGGYLSLVSQDEPSISLNDLEGRSYRFYGDNVNPVMQSVSGKLGIEPVKKRRSDSGFSYTPIEHLNNGFSDFIETNNYDILVYLRERNTEMYLLHTKHRVLFTYLVINKSFFESLTAKEQEIVEKAAVLAARDERRLFIEEEDVIMNSDELKNRVHYLSEDDQKRMDQIATEVENEFADLIGPELIAEVKAAR